MRQLLLGLWNLGENRASFPVRFWSFYDWRNRIWPIKLERSESCESSDTSFLEKEMFFPGENEKSPRNFYIVPRVTTHNSARVINGLTSRPKKGSKLYSKQTRVSFNNGPVNCRVQPSGSGFFLSTRVLAVNKGYRSRLSWDCFPPFYE